MQPEPHVIHEVEAVLPGVKTGTADNLAATGVCDELAACLYPVFEVITGMQPGDITRAGRRTAAAGAERRTLAPVLQYPVQADRVTGGVAAGRLVETDESAVDQGAFRQVAGHIEMDDGAAQCVLTLIVAACKEGGPGAVGLRAIGVLDEG